MRAISASPRLLIGSLTLAVAVVGVGAVTMFSKQEQTRELQRWQDKLNLIADARAREITKWSQSQSNELTTLANNPALQIYFSAVQSSDNKTLPQGDYVRNQLTVAAAHMGFQPSGPSLSQQVKANVGRQDIGGLALLGKEGQSIIATSYMPAFEGPLAEAFAPTADTKARMIALPAASNGSIRVGFTVPIYGIQTEHNAENRIGTLVGVRPVGDDVFAMLEPQVGADATLETALVQPQGEGVEYLAATETKAYEPNDANSAAAFAVENTNSMAQKMDYRGKPVLVVGRAIAGTPWTLIAKVDRDVALASSTAWRTRVTAAFLLMLVALASSTTLLWRHLAGRTAAAQAKATKAQADLLSVVTSAQPEAITMIDADERIRFANRAAAAPFGMDPNDAIGKNLTQMFGAEMTQDMRTHFESALKTGKQQQSMLKNSDRQIQCRFIPLAHVPVAELPTPTPGVLIVEQDVTDILRERSARLSTLNQLVETLVSLIDRRDPNTAQRSARIAVLAGGVARAMKLDERTVTTTETAARLMHIGQIDVPVEFMSRMAPLNEEERLKVRNALANSAETLSGIAFDGPVVDTLRQLQEHMDGTGPLKMKGEAILVSARILAAANVLIGMMTARRYRSPINYKDAVAKLMEEVDTRFDRKVITAMLNYLENGGGRQALETPAGERASK